MLKRICWEKDTGTKWEKTATIRAVLLSTLKCSMAQYSEAGRGCNALLENNATQTMHRTSGLCQAGQEAKASHRCFNFHRYFQCITSKVSSLVFQTEKWHHRTMQLCWVAEQEATDLLPLTLWGWKPLFTPLCLPHVHSQEQHKVLGQGKSVGACRQAGRRTLPTPSTAFTTAGSQPSLKVTFCSDAEH